MKNLIMTVSLAFLCIFLPSYKNESKEINLNDEMILTNEYTVFSKDEIYQDISLYLLYPHINEEINKYYSKYLTSSPTVYLYSPYTKILDVEKTQSGEYILKLRINSVYGPHIQVGTDEITIKINLSNVDVIDFNHIKSFELPPNYANKIKKGYNNPIP